MHPARGLLFQIALRIVAGSLVSHQKLTVPNDLRSIDCGISERERTRRCGIPRSHNARIWRRKSGEHSNTGRRLFFIILSACAATVPITFSANFGSTTIELAESTERTL